MIRVITYQQVLDEIKIVKDQKMGFITNFYPDEAKVCEWINSGELFIRRDTHTLFLIRERKEFSNLYYCAPSYETLRQTIPELNLLMSHKLLVIDLLGRKSDVILLSEFFRQHAFSDYVTLCRMSKSTDDECIQVLDGDLKTAKIQHSYDILELLNTYFDPIAEQLPNHHDILNWIKSGHILIYESGNVIKGFVIYDLMGLTSYLRYWFVHPEHRDKKIGSILLNKYFHDSKLTKRQLFWVIQSNDNAIKRYEHYGFKPENMFDIVMTNKNLSYEADSN